MKIPKILIASPTYEGMEYCREKFINTIKDIDYENYDILLVDNSKSGDYFRKLIKIEGINVIRDLTNEEKSVYRLISSRNLILKYALDNGYSYVLMLDSDVIPPKSILSELLSCNKDIVSGLYFNFFIVGGERKWLPVAWKSLNEEEFNELVKNYPLYSKFSRSDLKRHLTEKEVNSGELIEVSLPSAGCMLISREVFKKVRYGKFSESGGADDDRFFIDLAIKKGFTPFCSTKILCEHLVREKYLSTDEGSMIHSGFSDMLEEVK